MDRLQLPSPAPPIAKEQGQLLPQALHPLRHPPRLGEPAQAAEQLPQQANPAALLLEAAAQGHRRGVPQGQAREIREHQAQHEPIDRPTQAVAGVPAPVSPIQSPAEARPLQQGRELAGVAGFELLGRQQGPAAEHVLQGAGRQAFATELQQGEQSLGNPRLALLAAVRQTPRQAHPGGLGITEDGGYQRGECLHLGRHHQDVPRLEAGVRGQQLQDLIAHHLELAQPARAGVEFQGAILRVPMQGLIGLRFAADQLLLQLLQ